MVRISEASTITFRSDINPHAPPRSGILHGIRFVEKTPLVSEEHTFLWINNTSHMNNAIAHLEGKEFYEDNLIFVPYSTKEAWIKRYPLAVPSWECTEAGNLIDCKGGSTRAAKAAPKVPPMTTMDLARDIAMLKKNKLYSGAGGGKMTVAKARDVLPTVSVVIEKRVRRDFEDYWGKIMEFRAEHGHVDVPVKYDKDPKLGKWVNSIRLKKRSLETQGIEHEEPKLDSAGKATSAGAMILTKERIERLNSLGFSWDGLNLPTPRLSWDDRFQELMEYFQMNGRWPPHTSGTLGEWVHKQRTKWAKKDETFMRNHFHKLDEVGFKWKVRDRQTVGWETRFEQLAEFGRMNGHFDVPDPTFSEDVMSNYKTAEAARFYKWVNSLHAEYHAFKSEEGSKVLNDERVLSLIKLGFEFR